VRLKFVSENWEKYSEAKDELQEIGHDTNSQQQRIEMEERFYYLTGFIQTKMKELELRGCPESNDRTELVVKPKFPHLSISKIKVNLQVWVTFKHTFLSLVGDSTTIPNIQRFSIWYELLMGMQKESYSIYL